MTSRFAATSIVSSRQVEGGLEVILADAAGVTTRVLIPPELAAALGQVMGDAARSGRPGGAAALTKLPKEFAVGTGRHESVVLLRFEDDVPYGLTPSAAGELGRALLARSQEARETPARTLQ